MTDRELAARLGIILNCIGRVEGRAQALKQFVEFQLDDEHPFQRSFMDGLQRDIDGIERAAKECISAISGPLELREDVESPHEEGTFHEPEEWENDSDDEDSEWDDVQDV